MVPGGGSRPADGTHHPQQEEDCRIVPELMPARIRQMPAAIPDDIAILAGAQDDFRIDGKTRLLAADILA